MTARISGPISTKASSHSNQRLRLMLAILSVPPAYTRSELPSGRCKAGPHNGARTKPGRLEGVRGGAEGLVGGPRNG